MFATNFFRKLFFFFQFKSVNFLNQLRILISFDQSKLKDIVLYNRKTLNGINTWITQETLASSIYNYGIPENLLDKIDKDIKNDITYSDVILYLSSYIENVNYLELGISFGKNFYQVIKFLRNSNITGVDIEEINPKLEQLIGTGNVLSSWVNSDNFASAKLNPSTLKEYRIKETGNLVSYYSADIWDEILWKKLSNKKFNLIFSDAFHSEEALMHEYEMMKKFDLISEEFLIVYDDLHYGSMKKAVEDIAIDLSNTRNQLIDLKFFLVNGWCGINESKHLIGLLYYLPSKKLAIY